MSCRRLGGGMHGVDTNVVVRYLTGDDVGQAARARAVIGQFPVFVPRTVVLEVEWVLRSVYEMPQDRVISAIRGLAGLPGVTIEDAEMVATALDWAEAGMDFADAVHLAAARACESFLSFDRRLLKAGTELNHIPVRSP